MSGKDRTARAARAAAWEAARAAAAEAAAAAAWEAAWAAEAWDKKIDLIALARKAMEVK
jgi:hypothetical protein